MRSVKVSKKIKGIAGIVTAAAATSVTGIAAFAPTTAFAETTAVTASITQDRAKAIALNHAGAQVSQITNYKIEVDRERYGTFYEIEFNYNGYEYDYTINAGSGTIAEWDKEPIRGYNKPVNPVDSTDNKTSYVGEARAKATALTHAKLNANQISGYKITLDSERGVTYYDVDFYANGYEYDYDVNAKTGAIIKHQKELKDPRKAAYTGVAKSANGRWAYFKSGVINSSFTGVARSITGNWVFVRKGYVDFSYTGVAQSTTGNWVYVTKGRFNANATGVARSTTGNYVYVKNGRFNTKFTGIAKSLTTGDWVYVKNGRYYTGFTGNAKTADGRTMYVIKGRVR